MSATTRRAALVAGEVLRPPHLQHEIGVGERRPARRGDLGAGFAVALVRHAGGRAGAGLDRDDPQPSPASFLTDIRRRGDARLDRSVFLQDGDAHQGRRASRASAP